MSLQSGSMRMKQEWKQVTSPTRATKSSKPKYHTGITHDHWLVNSERPAFLVEIWDQLTTTPPAENWEDEHHLSRKTDVQSY